MNSLVSPEAAGVMSERSFELALGDSLDLLARVHTGVTLIAVSWEQPAPGAVEAAAAEALRPLGSVGRLPGGKLGLAYLGPRGNDDSGAEALSAYVRRRLRQRLCDSGWRNFAAPTVKTAHGWTDRIARPRDLIASLA